MIAHHFVSKTLRNGDPIPPDGEWLVWSGPVIICKTGLHASKHPMDALTYAPGETLCLVECEDIVTEQNDKFVCRRRKIVARFDATDTLWEMARWSALQVIHLWDAPQVVRDYMTTGDATLKSAAWSAARSATELAARSAAWSAAESAAWSAAESAAWSAAESAAWSAAESAAWSAAESAAWSAQRTHFLELVNAKFASMGVKT